MRISTTSTSPANSIAGQFVISDKLVSRQHLTIEVEEVGAKDCVGTPKTIIGTQAYTRLKANIRTRSRVTLVDLNTKQGTLVNGEQIRGNSYLLPQDQNTAILAKSKCHLKYTHLAPCFSRYLRPLGLAGSQLR